MVKGTSNNNHACEASQEVAIINRGSLTPLDCETVEGFEGMQRLARLLSASSLVPEDFRGNLPNCFLAIESARKLGVSVFTVLQNMFVIHNKPGWNAQFLIACFNASGKYSPIEYTEEGEGEDYGMYASCVCVATGQLLRGPKVTMRMAREEGWTKNGKWKTMPDLMLRYRAAAFFIRTTAPEIGLGIYTADELRDIAAQEGGRRTGRKATVTRQFPVEQSDGYEDVIPEGWADITPARAAGAKEDARHGTDTADAGEAEERVIVPGVSE